MGVINAMINVAIDVSIFVTREIINVEGKMPPINVLMPH
jgi:hypothetical protein